MHFSLPTKYYFINEFKEKHIQSLEKNIALIYRNYDEKININTIIKIKKVCKYLKKKFFLSNYVKLAIQLDLDGVYIPSFNKNININFYSKKKKFFLSNYIKLAIKLDLDGVYIPSFNKKININFYSKKKKFIILGSAHNIKEIRIKEKQNVSCIFLSPLFKVKKTKKYLDIHKFNYLSKYTKKKIVCLGGLKKSNLNKTNMLNKHGIASISLFKE